MVILTYRRVLSTHLLCNNNDFATATSPICEFPLFHKTDLQHRFEQLEFTVVHNIICAKPSICLLYYVKYVRILFRNCKNFAGIFLEKIAIGFWTMWRVMNSNSFCTICFSNFQWKIQNLEFLLQCSFIFSNKISLKQLGNLNQILVTGK